MSAPDLVSELATPLNPVEEALGGCAPAARLSRFLCTACLGTGKRLGERKASGHGHVTSTCGLCKGTGQRGGRL